MDIIVIVSVPEFSTWKFPRKEADQKNALVKAGIEPLAFRFNKYINIEVRPSPPEITRLLKGEKDCESWHTFVLKGQFLDKILAEVNEWVDEWDVEYTELASLLTEIFDKSERAIFAFERDSETIDKTYVDCNAEWIDTKIREVLNRKNKLEGFAVTKGLELVSM